MSNESANAHARPAATRLPAARGLRRAIDLPTPYGAPAETRLEGLAGTPTPILDYHGRCSLFLAELAGLMVRGLVTGDGGRCDAGGRS